MRDEAATARLLARPRRGAQLRHLLLQPAGDARRARGAGAVHRPRRALPRQPQAVRARTTRSRAAGVPALLGMGSTPGITNAMAGAMARGLDRVDEIHVRVGCLDRAAPRGPLPIPYALDTVLDEFALEPYVVEGGVARAVRAAERRGRDRLPASGRADEGDLHPALRGRDVSALVSGARARRASRWPSSRRSWRRCASSSSSASPTARPQVGDVSPRADAARRGGCADAAGRRARRLRRAARRSRRRDRGPGSCAGAASAVIRPHPTWGFGAGALDTGVPLVDRRAAARARRDRRRRASTAPRRRCRSSASSPSSRGAGSTYASPKSPDVEFEKRSRPWPSPPSIQRTARLLRTFDAGEPGRDRGGVGARRGDLPRLAARAGFAERRGEDAARRRRSSKRTSGASARR